MHKYVHVDLYEYDGEINSLTFIDYNDRFTKEKIHDIIESILCELKTHDKYSVDNFVTLMRAEGFFPTDLNNCVRLSFDVADWHDKKVTINTMDLEKSKKGGDV